MLEMPDVGTATARNSMCGLSYLQNEVGQKIETLQLSRLYYIVSNARKILGTGQAGGHVAAPNMA